MPNPVQSEETFNFEPIVDKGQLRARQRSKVKDLEEASNVESEPELFKDETEESKPEKPPEDNVSLMKLSRNKSPSKLIVLWKLILLLLSCRKRKPETGKEIVKVVKPL